MTPEEILRELRDIHLPPAVEAADPGFSFAPFLILALAAIVGAMIMWLRRRRWRRPAQARLRKAGMAGSPCAAWAEMIGLLGDLARIGRAGVVPDCAHLPPGRVGPAEQDRLRRHLDQVINGRADG